MENIVDFGEAKEAKEQAAEKKVEVAEANAFAEKVVNDVLSADEEKYENAHVDFMLSFVEKTVVKLETTSGFRFEEAEKENVLNATSVMPFTIEEKGDEIIRLNIDGDSFYYDLYLDKDLIKAAPELFDTAKEYLASMNDINHDIKEVNSKAFQLKMFGASMPGAATPEQLERLKAPLDPDLKAMLDDVYSDIDTPTTENNPPGITSDQLERLRQPLPDDQLAEIREINGFEFEHDNNSVGSNDKPKQVIGDLIRAELSKNDFEKDVTQEPNRNSERGGDLDLGM